MSNITISGTPGSGKSTIAELLNKHVSLDYVYSGMIFRSLAKEHNMSLAEFGKYCESHEDIDREIDEKQVQILKKGNVLLEGRLAGWLAELNEIPAFKIWIDADRNIRAERIVNREGGSVDDQLKKLLQRERSERRRYQKYYDIDVTNITIYDLVIDSSKKTPEEILKIILRNVRQTNIDIKE